MIRYGLSWFIIASGIAFSLYLLAIVPDGVYFSGDGGLKALLAQQLGEGIFQIDLVTPDAEWVHQLWENGLYPYEEPFVYYLNDKYYITFPYTFSLITAPFYTLFGERGLYVIPLLSTWLIWIGFNIYCRCLKLTQFQQCLSIFLLIFASNLTLYSGMYWEHTLAVLFCLIGMIILFIPRESITIKEAILSGFFVGLSAWIRSEFLAMVATLTFLVGVMIIIRYLSNMRSGNNVDLPRKLNLDQLSYLGDKGWIFILVMYVTVGLFFISNQLIYGHILGIHGLQIVEGFTIARRLREAWESFLEIIVTFFEFFPVACFSLLYLLLFLVKKSFQEKTPRIILISFIVFSLITSVYWYNTHGTDEIRLFLRLYAVAIILSLVWLFLAWKEEINITQRMALVYVLGLLFTAGVALLVDSGSDEIAVGGKQWGQRYLLILLPFFSIMIVHQLQVFLDNSKSIIKYYTIFLFSIFVIIGIYKNMYLGTNFFQKNHRGVTEAIEFLDNDSRQIVAVSHQFAAQILESPLRKDKLFFRVDQPESLIKLGQTLTENNQSDFVYVCYPFRACEIPTSPSETFTLEDNSNSLFQVQFNPLGKKGKYTLYEAKVMPKNQVN
ncbi:dolichol-phosphate mannosyltransferase [Crocosphaera sp.]|uniref:LA_3751/LA_3752 family putative glycosyltransferase n=1 Tax=Crocosphaera sp. TaxID=2729996 RepID=UPI002609E2C8|nr:dolichol-phosphate mannosyltransferase [Crocosphaera sp.]MDJ0579266.1 dolichol-phosphate mannosyltransferase [Crocosphaera sp.]